jgi:hypothetical protein
MVGTIRSSIAPVVAAVLIAFRVEAFLLLRTSGFV